MRRLWRGRRRLIPNEFVFEDRGHVPASAIDQEDHPTAVTPSLPRSQPIPVGSRLHFVFIDAALHYVDERGEHSGVLSEPAEPEEERTRLRVVSNSPSWLSTAVTLGDRLIDLARRIGEEDAWGCASGHYAGANSGTNRIAHAIREATGLKPPPPAAGPMARPQRGRWSVRQVFSYDPGPDAPSVAIWHLGFTENPQFWPRWCQAIANRPTPPVLILPDSPITRDLAAKWNAGELAARRRAWTSDNIANYSGEAAYLRARVSLVVEPDHSNIDGRRLTSAVAFLEARHQLRVSPFDLLRDPLLGSHLPAPVRYSTDWTPQEQASLRRLRREYDRRQRIHAWLDEIRREPPVGIFSEGESYEGSVSVVVQTAGRAVQTGKIAPVLVSSGTGFAPSALHRGERPRVPARSGSHGRLVDWYRSAFGRAVEHGIVDKDWFSSREQWHSRAFSAFPGLAVDYYEHIYAAERALSSTDERRRLTDASEVDSLNRWYEEVFRTAAEVGLCSPPEGAQTL